MNIEKLLAAHQPPPPGLPGSGRDSEITNPALSEKIRNLTGEDFLGKFIGNIFSLVLIIAALAAFFLLVVGGIQWITSGGDKAGLEGARGKIVNALIGLLIVFSAWAIILVIENFLGITILSGPITLPKI